VGNGMWIDHEMCGYVRTMRIGWDDIGLNNLGLDKRSGLGRLKRRGPHDERVETCILTDFRPAFVPLGGE
jgi:hypothetical protein